MSKAERESISPLIENEIIGLFGVAPGLANYFVREIKKFKAFHFFLFRSCWVLKTPKKVYCVVAYGRPALIKAAKERGIETMELQHGTISDFHPGYHYPGVVKGGLDYFPDRICLWDDFWKEMCAIPLQDENIIVSGFEHLERERKQYDGITKKDGQVVIISQGALGPRISDVLMKNIDDLRQYQILYKLHPGEYDRWKTYESLVRLSAYKNVKIIDNNDVPLYQLLAESKYVIGVYSTAIFESFNFGCRVVLLNLPGIEYMHRVVETGKAILPGRDEKLVDVLKEM